MSRALGITEEDLVALPRYRESTRFSPVEQLALDLAVAMSSTPAAVTDELRDALRARLSDGQLVELAATIAWENHRARLNRALGVRPMGFSDGAFCALADEAPATAPATAGTQAGP